MPRFRPVIAVVCALAWCSAVLHADLEAAGWLHEHHHHSAPSHSHDHHGESDHSLPETDDIGHEPIVARTSGAENGLPAPLLMAALLPLLALAVAQQRRPDDRMERWVPRPSARDLKTRWQFLWRCAPDSAAPPALS